MPPRIVHLPRCFAAQAWGGTEAVVRALAGAAEEHGYRAAIVTSRALDPTPHDNLDGTPVIRLPYAYGEWPLSAARRNAFDRKGGNLHVRGLPAALDGLDDVALLHLHTGGRFGAQALRVARRRGWPCVLTLHGGHFCIPPAERQGLTSPHSGFSLRWGRLLSWWWRTRALLHAVDAVICVGIDEYDAARAALPHQRVFLIPGGVDSQRFVAADAANGRQLAGLGERPVIGCLARLDALKDQRTLVAAWRRLTIACDLLLIGAESTPGYAELLRQDADGGPGRCILLGNVTPTAVPDLLAACTVLAFPSRHEPFGIAVLEGWAAQRPMVATAVGGPAWLLRDGAGVLVPPADPAALASALDGLLRDPQRCDLLVQKGTTALRGHTWNDRTTQTHEVYRDLLASTRL